MMKLKEEHKNKVITSPKLVGKINTNDIKDNEIEFYTKQGFGDLFEFVCDKCECVDCTCVKPKKKTTKKKKDESKNK